MSPERFALEQSVYLSPSVGEPCSGELVKVVSTLLYFAASVCDRDPEQLKLGHLVGALVRPERSPCSGAHPMRRSSDRPREVAP